MSSESYKKNLTKLGSWSVVLGVTMPFFALFFFAAYSCYAGGPALHVEPIAATFAYGAAVSGILAAVGVIMILMSREVYVAEEKIDTNLPQCGLREFCAAA